MLFHCAAFESQSQLDSVDCAAFESQSQLDVDCAAVDCAAVDCAAVAVDCAAVDCTSHPIHSLIHSLIHPQQLLTSPTTLSNATFGFLFGIQFCHSFPAFQHTHHPPSY